MEAFEISGISTKDGLREMVVAKSLDGQEVRFKLRCLAKDIQGRKE
jgi:hypothetical protein